MNYMRSNQKYYFDGDEYHLTPYYEDVEEYHEDEDIDIDEDDEIEVI